MDEPTAKHAAPTRVANIDLCCKIRRHNHSSDRQEQLNTAVASFVNFNWVVHIARYLFRINRAHIHWFVPGKLFRED